MSLNIWDLPLWYVPRRRERVIESARYFRSISADIICLQESFVPEHRALLLRELAGEYVTTDTRMESRRTFFLKFDTSGGLVIFSRFPIIRGRFVPFPRALISSPIEYFGRKGFLIAEFATPGGILRVVNTHLHLPSLMFDGAVRKRQLDRIFSELHREKRLATILAGDLNEDVLDPDHREIARLLAGEGFVNGHRGAYEPSYRADNPNMKNFWLNGISTSERRDFIFYNNLDMLHVRLDDYRVLHPPQVLSDHNPILLTLADAAP